MLSWKKKSSIIIICPKRGREGGAEPGDSKFWLYSKFS